jgi:hypothetical protein
MSFSKAAPSSYQVVLPRILFNMPRPFCNCVDERQPDSGPLLAPQIASSHDLILSIAISER